MNEFNLMMNENGICQEINKLWQTWESFNVRKEYKTPAFLFAQMVTFIMNLVVLLSMSNSVYTLVQSVQFLSVQQTKTRKFV